MRANRAVGLDHDGPCRRLHGGADAALRSFPFLQSKSRASAPARTAASEAPNDAMFVLQPGTNTLTYILSVPPRPASHDT